MEMLFNFIVGIITHYSTRPDIQHGCADPVHESTVKYNFWLKADERIKMATVGFSYCITGIKFETNMGRTFGPYGVLEPNRAESGAIDNTSLHYLAAFGGSVLRTKGQPDVISQLALIWGECRLPFIENNT